MHGLSLGLILLLSGAVGWAQPTPQPSSPSSVPPETISSYEQLYTGLHSPAREWVDSQVEAALQQRTLDISQLQNSAIERFPRLRTAQKGEAQAFVGIVLTETMKQAATQKESSAKQMGILMKLRRQVRDQIEQVQSEQASASSRPKADICNSVFCRSLPSRLAILNDASSSLRDPFQLQLPMNPTYLDIQRLINTMEDKYHALCDETQQTGRDLQNSTQLEQKASTLLSQLSNQQHGTANEAINNLK